ncbi:MAG: hypothetical protein GAK28_01069 [Luteibacter sp.]|uniref:VirK/YbjX family protein n=1 Tax=Luteibacter sp. TaxID=1886636 RepID=UPI0013847A22|nr:DUF535 family protein [Luteibacter sp.]KAF1008645.1 MAG: hypothetical protein GAK28_01069 [Luteibacter sp.]
MPALNRMLQSFRDRDDWSRRRSYQASALRYALRCLGAPLLHLRWLTLLDSHPGLRAAVRRDGRLIERWQHRFLRRGLGPRRTLRTLLDHFDFVSTRLPAGMLEQLYVDGRVELTEAAMKSGEPLRVLLMPPVRKGCEGELNLALATADDTLLFSATITLVPSRRELLVGCLQGPSTEDGQDRVRTVTRQCHGLRPKNLLLSLLYALAAEHGIRRIRGIGNARHALARSGKVKASYDAFWLESGGVLARDGLFDLPPSEPVRDEQEVASKHRSAFRQREALRHELARRMIAALSTDGARQDADAGRAAA